ncbi:hypothetical protein OAK75_09440 [Bacteriovoracales bacterium]|nr:hypothetical protein [Bacteriovoracales bacterium]
MKTLSKLTSLACSLGLLTFHFAEFNLAYAQSNLACIDRKDTESKSREARLETVKKKAEQNTSAIKNQEKIIKDLRAKISGKKSSGDDIKQQEKISELTSDLEKEKEKLDELTQERDTALKTHGNEFTVKISEIDNQKKVISDLEAKLNTTDTSSLSEDMSLEDAKKVESSGKKSGNEELKDQLENEQDKLKTLEEELKELSSKIKDDNPDIAQKNETIENQKKIIEEKQEGLDKESEKLSEGQKTSGSEGDQLVSLSEKLKAEQKKLDELKQEQKNVEKELTIEKKKIVLEEQITSGNLSDFQLYEAAMAEVLIQDKALAQDDALNFKALGLALNNIEIMSTAASALNHLDCKPYGENDSKSYHLFVGAAATYVVDQINRVRNFKKASECQIETGDIATDSEDLQVEALTKAYEQYSILSDAVQKRYTGRQDSTALFQEALIAATDELTEKVELVGTARGNYEKGKEWVTKTAWKLAGTLTAAIIAYNTFFGIVVALVLFALAVVFAVDLVKAVLYRDNWYNELLKGRNHTRLTCNYADAEKYEPSKKQASSFKKGINEFISSIFTPAHVVASGSDPKAEGEFPKFLEMKKDFWMAQSYDPSSLLDMDQDALVLDTLKDSQKSGFSLVETRVVYLQTMMNGLFDPNILAEFMKAYDLTRKNKDQLWNLYSQAKSDLQSIVTIEKGNNEEKKFVTKTCLQKSTTGKGKPDLKCDCQESKTCKQFEFPTFKNLEGKFVPPKRSFVRAVNFSLAGDTEKAQVEKVALRKNAASLRKKLKSQKARIDKMRKKQNRKTKSIDTHAAGLLNSFQQGPLSYRQKAESSFASFMETQETEKKQTPKKGGEGVEKVVKRVPTAKKAAPRKKKKKMGKFVLEGFVDSDKDLEDAEIDATMLEGTIKVRKKRKRTPSELSTRKDEAKEVNKESELNLFRIISRRYRKSGYPRLLRKKKKKDDKAFSF